LENTNSNEELDKLKGECKRWKNAYFNQLAVSIMLYKKICAFLAGGTICHEFSVEGFQETIQRLRYQFDDSILINDTKQLFEARTGEQYNEN
jgi:hypothetical protein